MTSYNIMLNNCVVGTAEIITEGMYLRIQARCTTPDTQIYKLILLCGSQRIDLGVCVPENELFITNKRIQRKIIGEETPAFFLETKQRQNGSQFMPIDANCPFEYLDRLPFSCFETRNGVFGVTLR